VTRDPSARTCAAPGPGCATRRQENCGRPGQPRTVASSWVGCPTTAGLAVPAESIGPVTVKRRVTLAAAPRALRILTLRTLLPGRRPSASDATSVRRPPRGASKLADSSRPLSETIRLLWPSARTSITASPWVTRTVARFGAPATAGAAPANAPSATAKATTARRELAPTTATPDSPPAARGPHARRTSGTHGCGSAARNPPDVCRSQTCRTGPRPGTGTSARPRCRSLTL
jgi:hypothetical protein